MTVFFKSIRQQFAVFSPSKRKKKPSCAYILLQSIVEKMRFWALLTRKKEENQGCKKEKHRKTVLRYDRFYCIPQMRYIGWRGDHIVISMNCIPSGKQVRRAREKRLITVFREAMSRIASRSRRVYRADDMRHKSGRGMRCAGQK